MDGYPDHRSLYRLPWSLPDNPIAWLEPTEACNLYCEGCYRANQYQGHKSLRDIEADLDTFARYRSFDGVSIAGGDPLTHPEVVSIVALARAKGYKPILNTNGLALTDELLRELKGAGLVGFTFHIDSKQGRPGWKGKTEAELNALRQEFAERVASVGGISVAFNATVYDDTLPYAPEVVAWARKNIDKVHVVVFIAYRQASGAFAGEMDFWVGDQKVPMNDLVYSRPTGKARLDISSRDVVAEIRKRFPDFAPCAYLNGTERADSLKWLLTTYVGTKDEVVGYAGPRFMEATQVLHHWRHGRFLAYAPPSTLRHGRSITATGALFDRGMREGMARYLGGALRRPLRPLPRLHLQSVMIIQPVDVLADGRMNMCDACPDMTVHEGELVWSCRLEERKAYGGFARGVRRSATSGAPAEPVLAEETALP
ncbi:MAG TPA: radical SAM protein [Candidatus Omnitrophota bacterium]|jgi:pyruvate-formate lyase-activating enzyme|nr:radical SAM protein [Candidatus Omnitrophota bacterium]